MINQLKLILAEFGHKGNYVNDNEIIHALKTKGYYYYPDFLNKGEIDEVLEKFNYLFKRDELVKYESNNCDKRIYAADKRVGFKLKKLEEFSAPLFKRFSFFKKPYHFLLLGWLEKGKDNLGSGGGWHRDSPISHQFKTILYLTDVNEENGPFQFVSGSQKWRNNLLVCKKLNKPLSKRRFSNEEIDLLVADGVIEKPVTFTSKAGGLIIADTRGLHRGKPLLDGERKAITRYHFTSDIGEKFYR